MDEDNFNVDEGDFTKPDDVLDDDPIDIGEEIPDPDIPDHDTDGEQTERERATAAIVDKFNDLRHSGFDLGDSSGPVQDVSHGGWVRVYDHGRIYWHPANHIGAHEVHGGILEKYLDIGGPDRHPSTNHRELKFPTSDETRSADDRTPVSFFEEGAIYWLGGNIGGVAIWGAFYDRWQVLDGVKGRLGYPLTDPHDRGSTKVAFFEHGCLCRRSGRDGEILYSAFDSDPLLGRQTVIDPAEPGTLEFGSPIITWVPDAIEPGTGVTLPDKIIDFDEHVPGSDHDTDPIPTPEDAPEVDEDRARQVRTAVAAAWEEALVLTESDPTGDSIDIPLTPSHGGVTPTNTGGEWTVVFRTDLRVSDPDRLVRGMPYDIDLRLPEGGRHQLFSRAVRVPAEASTIPSDIMFTEEAIDVIGPVTLRRAPDQAGTIQLDTEDAVVVLGGDGEDGGVLVRNGTDVDRIHLDGGGGGPSDATHVRIHADGELGSISLGGDGQAGELMLRDGEGAETIRIDGASGDISLRAADAAETIGSLEGKIADLERRIEDLEE